MGSFSELYISDFPIFSAKNNYCHQVVEMIFLSEDFKQFERPLKQRNRVTWGNNYINEEGTELVTSFCSTVQIYKERLELFGASYAKAKIDFENALKIIREEELYDFALDYQLTYELYLEKVRGIIESRKKKHDTDADSNFEDYLQDSQLLVENQSINLGLWSILSVADQHSTVEYNLTDIINGGWISENPQKSINTEKIIVLTEGKTDTEFLKIGIRNFFPHLEGFYHFMDFENSRYEANASRLVHTIKSFVGSGIKSLIIALFDNDSAASKEIHNLRSVNLPKNIKVLQYPNIDWAKNYPTIGSSGIQRMDINGLAGSIEMYLGRDCLKENEKFIPIQSTGYVGSIKKCQGVIQHKKNIQKKFREKAKKFNKSAYELDNWKELISIIEMINEVWK